MSKNECEFTLLHFEVNENRDTLIHLQSATCEPSTSACFKNVQHVTKVQQRCGEERIFADAAFVQISAKTAVDAEKKIERLVSTAGNEAGS